MNKFTDEQKKEFLTSLVEKTYPHADNHYVSKTKKGAWRIGHINDYPLQHGEGEFILIPDKMVDIIMEEARN